MQKSFYRTKERQIIMNHTLEALALNTTSDFIFNRLNQGLEAREVIYQYQRTFDIDESMAREDVQMIMEEFEKLGIVPQEVIRLEKHAFMPHTVIVHIIQNCNSPCIMCECWRTRKKTWHSARDLKPFFEIIAAKGAKSIMVSGGEPLLHPEIREIIQSIHHLGMKVLLNTNAILLDKHLHWLREERIEEIVFSMDTINAHDYQLIRGAPAYDRVWQNVTEFKRHSPQTRLVMRSTLNKQNLMGLGALIEKAKQAGVDTIGFSPLDIDSESFSRKQNGFKDQSKLKAILFPASGAIDQFLNGFHPHSNYYLKLEKYFQEGIISWSPQDFIKCLCFYRDLLANKSKEFSHDPCMFPTFSMLLDYNGDLKNCFYSQAFGNLYAIDKAQWDLSAAYLQLKASKTCASCRGKIFCDNGLFREKTK